VPRHHHVNLGVPPGGIEAQESFLVDVLGYQRMNVSEDLRAMGVKWFEGSDGSQIHLSEDPDHSPPKRAHVAVECSDDELPIVEKALEAAGISTRNIENTQIRKFLVFKDPSGNRWEIRSAS
jgi:catechol 2,3-dioxygenase-like lactoylglutathione lyase family enzyme